MLPSSIYVFSLGLCSGHLASARDGGYLTDAYVDGSPFLRSTSSASATVETTSQHRGRQPPHRHHHRRHYLPPRKLTLPPIRIFGLAHKCHLTVLDDIAIAAKALPKTTTMGAVGGDIASSPPPSSPWRLDDVAIYSASVMPHRGGGFARASIFSYVNDSLSSTSNRPP